MKEYNLTVELECIPILGLLYKSVLLTLDKKKKNRQRKRKKQQKNPPLYLG